MGEHLRVRGRVVNGREVPVGQLERLHLEPAPGVVRDAPSAYRIGQLVAGDREKPRDRHDRQLAVRIVDSDKRLGKRLAHQIRGQLGARNSDPQKPEDIASSCSVEQAERSGIALARAPQQITIMDMHSSAHGR